MQVDFGNKLVALKFEEKESRKNKNVFCVASAGMPISFCLFLADMKESVMSRRTPRLIEHKKRIIMMESDSIAFQALLCFMTLEWLCVLSFFLLFFHSWSIKCPIPFGIVICFLRVCSFYLAGTIFVADDTYSWRFVKTAFGEIGIFLGKKAPGQELLGKAIGCCLLFMNAYSYATYIAVQQAGTSQTSKSVLALFYCLFIPLIIDVTAKANCTQFAKKKIYTKYLNKMKDFQLRSELYDRNLPTSGLVADLRVRLLEALLRKIEPASDNKLPSTDPRYIVSFSNQILCAVWLMICIDLVTFWIS